MRVDAAVETGSVVGTDYDSMIAKVIAHGPDRATALARLDRALAGTAILGLTTNTGFLRTLIAHEGVREGEMDTGLIGRLEPAKPPLSDEQVARAAAALALPDAPATTRGNAATAGAWAASARPSYWKLSVDGGEPLDIVLATTRASSPRFISATGAGSRTRAGRGT